MSSYKEQFWETMNSLFPIHYVTNEGHLRRVEGWDTEYDYDSTKIIGYYSREENRVVNLAKELYTDDEIEHLYWETALLG